jgi:hypothetical protein
VLVGSQDLDLGALSFTTNFLDTQAGYLSYVGISFSSAPEASETIVVYVASRNGSTFDTELGRISTIAGTTKTVTFLFNESVPVNALDQIKVTCTNNSQSVGEVNDDPTVSVTVAMDTTARQGGIIQIYRDGQFVVAEGIHDYRMHFGDVIPDANQDFGPYYSDWTQMPTPSNPATGTRRLFVDSSTGQLSVRTSAGTTVSLEAAGSGYTTIYDETTQLTQRSNLKFTGSGVTCTDNGTDSTVCDVPSGSGYNTVYDESTQLTQRSKLKFTGGGVTCTDNGTDTTVCDVPSGSGSGDITTVGSCLTGDCAVEGGQDVFPMLYEGTANAFETTFTANDPTADRTITFPDATGEVSLLGQTIDLTSEVTGTLPVANGGTGRSSLTGDDYTLVADSATSLTPRQLPNCTDTGGQHLNYSQATNTFSCGTSSGSSGTTKLMFSGNTNGTAMSTSPAYHIVSGQSGPASTESKQARANAFVLSGTFKNMYCELGTAPGAGNTRSVTLTRLGPTATAVTCNIAGTATTCSDTTNTATITASASSPVYMEYRWATVAGTPANSTATCSIEFDPS